jgi:hypothetical protein
MEVVGREMAVIELYDTVKDNTLTIHASETSLIADPITTPIELYENYIFSCGKYLEDRLAASKFEKIQDQ